MQEQQWCTGCFSLVSTSILYEKHSISCPLKENIKYSTSTNPNAVNKLPVLNRYPNNEELYKMVVALTDNLNKANKTISALKRKINLRSNKIEVLEFLNENILPSVSVDAVLTQLIHISDCVCDDSSVSDSDEQDHDHMNSIDTFYEIGFYSFVLQCLSNSLHKDNRCHDDHNQQGKGKGHGDEEGDEEGDEDVDEEGDEDIIHDSDIVDDIAKEMETLDMDHDNASDNDDKQLSSIPVSKLHIPPILSFKQKKDTVYIYEHNCWSQIDISEFTVNNFFNRYACIVHSKIIKLFSNFKNRHENELYNSDFQAILSKRLKCICSINMDDNNIVSKIIKPWYNSNKLDLYDFMNCN